MQYKNKKNLYKIVFITILLGFIISLAGCNWLSLGLLNIFDPQAQIRVDYTGMNLEEGTIALEVYSLNEVEFIGSGFKYEYYVDSTKITSLTKTVGATFYVAPSTSPGTPGPTTSIDLLLYYQEVQDYITSNPLVTELTCTISLLGTDGAGHSISKSVTVDLPALQPGIDFEPPTAVINVTPGTTGTEPFTVIFDAYGSTDNRGIASYAWDFGDGTTGTGIMPAAHTYTDCGSYIVKLTVTDYWDLKGYAIVIIDVGETGGPDVVINVEPGTTGTAPFKVYFDASDSTFEIGCEVGTATYSWDFGDGTTGTGMTTSHTYTAAGTYNVILTVTDSNGNVGYASVTITVTEVGVPTAVISTTPDPPTGIAPFPVNFDASQSSGPSSIVSYAWNFGDTTTGTGMNISHTYAAAGTYTVILTVTDSNSNVALDSVTITVYEAGVPSTLTLQANPVTVTVGGGTSLITATVEDAGGDPVTDGTVVAFIATSPGSLSAITTTTGGTATATLTLSNATDATISSTVGATSGTASDNVTVYCPPPAP